jgi:hypothetical protein
MPALNFKKQFADNILAGLLGYNNDHGVTPKRCSLRKTFKGKEGDKLFLFTGMRTKHCQRLGETTVLDAMPIIIFKEGFIRKVERSDFNYSDKWHLTTNKDRLESFAKSDGFSNWNEMVDFFDELYGLPTELVQITW